MYFSALLVTLLTAVAVNAYPTGVPTTVCESMMPGHGVPPQTSPSPYEMILEKSKLEGGQSMKVTIKGKDDIPFRGFMIQARFKNNPVGKFSVSENEGNLLSCGEGKEDTVSHVSASDKNEVTVEWTAPEKLKGEVIFYLTTVKVFDTFWVKQKSSPVIVS